MKKLLVSIPVIALVVVSTYYFTMSDFIKPTALTNASNEELVNKSVPRGDVISDGTNDRIIAGFQKDGFGNKNFGFKVSQEGYDVKTATDDQLIMSSSFNMLKIIQSGIVSVDGADGPGSNYEDVIIENATEPVAFLAYIQNVGNYGTPLPSFNLGAGGTIVYMIFGNASYSGGISKIRFTTVNANPAGTDPNTYRIKYYAFVETAPQ